MGSGCRWWTHWLCFTSYILHDSYFALVHTVTVYVILTMASSGLCFMQIVCHKYFAVFISLAFWSSYTISISLHTVHAIKILHYHVYVHVDFVLSGFTAAIHTMQSLLYAVSTLSILLYKIHCCGTYRKDFAVVFDLDPDWIRFVSEVPETSSQLLLGTVTVNTQQHG